MTTYELAIKHRLGKQLAYQLEVMNVIPKKKREDSIESIAKEIHKYWSNQRSWEIAKELNTPKQVKDIKRSVRKLHQENINRAVQFYRVVTSPITEQKNDEEFTMSKLYGTDLLLSPSAILEIADYIEALYTMDIDKQVDKLHNLPARPSKEPIQEVVRNIFIQHHIAKYTDFMRDFLPLI